MLSYIIGMVALLYFYRTLHIFLIRRRSKQPIKIIDGAEPFFWQKEGDTVALLIHGFTSSPGEMKHIAEFLYEKGISVYTPLLPGHGTSPERLSLIKYQQWIEYIEEQIKMLEKNYENIYLIGNSFGGNIALMTANASPNIRGMVTVDTPIFFYNERTRKYLFYILSRIKLFQKKKYRSKKYESLVKTKAKSYDSIPLKSLSQVLKAINISKLKLQDITAPILVIQAQEDHIVKSESAGFILGNVKSKIKNILTIPGGSHVMILDKHEDRIKQNIYDFILKT